MMDERIITLLITDISTFFTQFQKKLNNIDSDEKFVIIFRRINRREAEYLISSHIITAYLEDKFLETFFNLFPYPIEPKKPDKFWENWEIIDFYQNPVLIIDFLRKPKFYFLRFKP